MYPATLNTKDDDMECIMKLKFRLLSSLSAVTSLRENTVTVANKKLVQKNELELPVRNCRTLMHMVRRNVLLLKIGNEY